MTAAFRLKGTAICLAVLLLFSWGCKKAPEVPAGQRITVAVIGTPRSLSPILARDSVSREVQAAYVRGLTQTGPDGRLQPSWAAAAPTREAGTFKWLGGNLVEYRLAVRGNAAWSDGQPLLGTDFLFGYTQALHPLLRAEHDDWTGLVQRFELSGPRDVRLVALRNPRLNALDVFPLPEATLGKAMRESPTTFSRLDFHQRPLSSGPFVLSSGSANGLDLARNDRFEPTKARVAQLAVRYYSHVDDALEALRKREVDVLTDIPAERAATWDPQDQAIRVERTPGARLVQLVFNTRDPVLRHDEVRRALAGALDRAGLEKSLGTADALRAQSWLVPQRAGFEAAFARYDVDVAVARKALLETGWKVTAEGGLKRGPTTRTFRLLVNADDAAMRQAAEGIVRSWERVGVKLVLEARPAERYHEGLQRRDFAVALQEAVFYPWTQPAVYYAKDSTPTSRNGFRGENVSGWSDSEHEALLREIARAAVPADAAGALKRQQALIARDVPILPLYFWPQICAYRADLRGIRPRGYGALTWNVEEWHWK